MGHRYPATLTAAEQAAADRLLARARRHEARARAAAAAGDERGARAEFAAAARADDEFGQYTR
jgi:hypothetical protein